MLGALDFPQAGPLVSGLWPPKPQHCHLERKDICVDVKSRTLPHRGWCQGWDLQDAHPSLCAAKLASLAY